MTRKPEMRRSNLAVASVEASSATITSIRGTGEFAATLARQRIVNAALLKTGMTIDARGAGGDSNSNASTFGGVVGVRDVTGT
jgi:hypothetical protein